MKDVNEFLNIYGFTKVPNVIFDEVMPQLRGTELSVYLVIYRKTIGYQKCKDRIALSTFVKESKCAKNSVLNAIKSLCSSSLIHKDESTIPHSFEINFAELESLKNSFPKVVQNSNTGVIVEPEMVQSLDHQLVQKLDPQKKEQNKIKETTTSSIDESVFEILEAWNTRFSTKVELDDLDILKEIQNALAEFSVDQVVSAMDNRLKADYYKLNKPYLLNNPKCFFPYPETIQTDLNRDQKKLIKYEKMVSMITEKGFRDEQFKIRRDKLDTFGKPFWELID